MYDQETKAKEFMIKNLKLKLWCFESRKAPEELVSSLKNVIETISNIDIREIRTAVSIYNDISIVTDQYIVEKS